MPEALLQPRGTWDDGAEYDAQARRLAEMFSENFKTFEGQVDAVVLEAGPKF